MKKFIFITMVLLVPSIRCQGNTEPFVQDIESGTSQILSFDETFNREEGATNPQHYQHWCVKCLTQENGEVNHKVILAITGGVIGGAIGGLIGIVLDGMDSGVICGIVGMIVGGSLLSKDD